MAGTSFLLDTNVISETRKTRPNEDVLRFLRQLSPSRAFVSVLSLGELRRGAAIRAKHDIKAARDLSDWIDGLEEQYAGRVLAVDDTIARLWGELSADRSRPVVDTLLAATAIHHRLTLVTRNVRNVRNVEDTPVMLRNPWLEP